MSADDAGADNALPPADAPPQREDPLLVACLDEFVRLLGLGLATEMAQRGAWPPPEWIDQFADKLAAAFVKDAWPGAPALQSLMRLVLGRVGAELTKAIVAALVTQTGIMTDALGDVAAQLKARDARIAGLELQVELHNHKRRN